MHSFYLFTSNSKSTIELQIHIHNLSYKLIMIKNYLITLRKFCTTKLPTTSHHLGDNVAFGYDFPKHLNQQSISKILDPTSKDIQRVQHILNKLGVPTGKVIVHFKDKQLMEKYTRKYNEDFITINKDIQKILLKPMVQKTKNKNQEQQGFPVKLSKLDYEINEEDIRKIANDFGDVVGIDISIRPNGLNSGRATVRFREKKSMQDFFSFANGLQINGRKISATLETKSAQKEDKPVLLSPPRKMMQANYRLYAQHHKQTAVHNGPQYSSTN